MSKFKKMMYLKMARAFGGNVNAKQVPTIIGETTKISGDVNSNGILQVDGCVEGDVNCEELVIGVKGHIIGTVKAQSMYLYGTLQGKAIADNLFVAKTAKVIGDVAHNSIAIEPGASIDGYFIKVRSDQTVNSVIDMKNVQSPQIVAEVRNVNPRENNDQVENASDSEHASEEQKTNTQE